MVYPDVWFTPTLLFKAEPRIWEKSNDSDVFEIIFVLPSSSSSCTDVICEKQNLVKKII